MTKTLLLLGLGFLFICNSFAQETRNDTMQNMFNEGQFEALNEYTEHYLVNEPEDIDLLYYSAISAEQLGDLQHSYLQLSKAIELYPDTSYLYNVRGSLLLSVNEFDAALADYKNQFRLAESDQEFVAARLNIAAAQMSTRKFDSAKVHLEKALEIDSNNVGLLINIASVYSEMGMNDIAIKHLEKAIELDPEFIASTANLGFIHLEIEEYEKALYYFNKVLEMEPDDPYTLNNRGYAKFKLGDLLAALDDINLSIELYPVNPYAYRNRALIYLALKKERLACADLHLALNNNFTVRYGNEVNELIEKHCK